MKKFYKTTFVVEILSATPGVADMDLKDALEEAETGSFSGEVKSSEEVEVDGPTMAKLCIEQRSDPYFLGLTHDGRLLCFVCEGTFDIDENGIANHVDEDGNVDHDADADHVPLGQGD